MPPKKTYRKKKMYKRKYRISKVPKFKANSNHNIARWVSYGYATASNIATVNAGIVFKLNDLPNYTEFTTLFDEYQIYKIKLRFFPRFCQMNTTINKVTPLVIYAVDHDDAVAPADINTLLQYPSCRFTDMTKSFSVTFRPKVSMLMYNTAVTSGYGSSYHWVDCNYSAVEHYGFKYILDQSTDANAFSYYILCKMFVRFRSPR